MMKASSSNLAAKAAAGALMLGVLAPSLALAEATAPATTAAGTKTFCARIADIDAKVLAGMGDRTRAYEAKKAERTEKMATNRAERDQKLAATRTAWDQNRAERYAKLDERATTTAQKAAVATFKNELEAAVVARKTAIDAALVTYRNGLDQAIQARKTAIDGAQTTLKTSVTAALENAKTDCAADKDPKTVRVTALGAIKAARDAYATTVKAQEKVGTTLDALTNARNTAIKKAIDDAKAARERAVLKLKAAFKETT